MSTPIAFTISGLSNYPTTYLQPGDTGPSVVALQQWLINNGFLTQAQMNTGPGHYGPATTAAVASLQSALGVNAGANAGDYGPLTIAAIQHELTVLETPTATPIAGPFNLPQGQLVTFSLFPPGTFTDPQHEMLTYSATLSTGAPLPSWLTFNAGSFSGTVPVGTAGLSIKVTATNTSGLSTSETFLVSIVAGPTNPNTPPQAMPIVINTIQDLENINNNLSGNYVLGQNIDASGFLGFVPIGSIGNPFGNSFSGTFDGAGHTISNLTINPGPTTGEVGIFAEMGATAVVKNLTLAHMNVVVPAVDHVSRFIGTLVGLSDGTIQNVVIRNSSVVADHGTVGGLAGQNNGLIIDSSAATNVYVTSTDMLYRSYAGGLVGANGGGGLGVYARFGQIIRSSASGTVTGSALFGGGGTLAGGNNGSIEQSFATGSGLMVVQNNGTVTPPIVTGIIASQFSGTLATGDNLSITLEVSEPVKVTGTPMLILNDGGIATYDAAKSILDPSVSGTLPGQMFGPKVPPSLVFDYTVGPGQHTSDLQVVAMLGEPSIRDLAGNALTGTVMQDLGLQVSGPILPALIASQAANVFSAFLSLFGLGGNSSPPPATGPSIVSITTSTLAKNLAVRDFLPITVHFNQPVIVGAATPSLILNDGDGATAAYTSGSGTNTLLFTYRVAPGQHTTDLKVTSISNESSIRNNAGSVLTGAVSKDLGVAVQVPPGELLGFDTNQSISLTQAFALKEAGYSFAMQYIGHLTPSTVQSLAAAGIKIGTIFQKFDMSAHGDYKGYFSTAIAPDGKSVAFDHGFNDAASAYLAVSPTVNGSLGQPFGSAIYFAIDVLDPSVQAGVQSYFDGIKAYFQGIGNPYSVGVYGPASTVASIERSGDAPFGWVSESWTDPSSLYKTADLYQTNVSMTNPNLANNQFHFAGIGGQGIDVDYAPATSSTGFGGWTPSLSSTNVSNQSISLLVNAISSFGAGNGQGTITLPVVSSLADFPVLLAPATAHG